MGSLSDAGRLFHNIGPLNLIDRFPNVDCTEDTCKLLQFRVYYETLILVVYAQLS